MVCRRTCANNFPLQFSPLTASTHVVSSSGAGNMLVSYNKSLALEFVALSIMTTSFSMALVRRDYDLDDFPPASTLGWLQ